MMEKKQSGLTVFRYDDYPVVPWKNGLGVTRNIVGSPCDGDDFDWLLTLADISQSGNFSEFPGQERIITLIDGNGFSLDVGPGLIKQIDQVGNPFSFDVGVPVYCEVKEGLSRVFNIKTKGGRMVADWSMLDVKELTTFNLVKNSMHIFFCLQETVLLDNQKLGKWDCAHYTDPEDATLQISANLSATVFQIKLSYL